LPFVLLVEGAAGREGMSKLDSVGAIGALLRQGCVADHSAAASAGASGKARAHRRAAISAPRPN